jgi:hypothetical protein
MQEATTMNTQPDHGTTTTTFAVRPSDLGAILVDQLHLQVTSFSPFAEILADYAPGSGSMGDTGRQLANDAGFARVAGVLARPDLRLELLVGGGMAPLGSLRAYASKATGNMLVVIAPGDSEWDIRLFDAPRSCAEWVARQTGTNTQEGEPNHLAPPCTLSTLVAAFHTIDAFRRTAYQDMLAYKRTVDPMITPEEFRSSAEAAIHSQDIRWLLPSLLVLNPGLVESIGMMGSDGLEQAVKRGFLVGAKRAGGTDTVLLFGEAGTHMGSEFLRSWVSSCGYSMDVVGPDGPRTLQRGYIASTALANHWFRFETKDDTLQVNHQPLSLEQYAQKMGDVLLSGTVVERQAGAAGAFVKPKQAVPSRSVSPEKTISANAAPTKTPKFCPGCGAPVKPGAKFCASCGRPL